MPELRALVRQRLRRERGRTEELRTTAVLDTALRRMFKQAQDEYWNYERVWNSWEDVRRHFRLCMNRAITDHFRLKRPREVRFESWSVERFDEIIATTPAFYDDPSLSYLLVKVLALLQERSPRSHDLLEKRLIWGYSPDELLQDAGCGERQLRRYQRQAQNDLRAVVLEVLGECGDLGNP